MGTASTLLLRSPHCQVSDTSVTSLPAFILRLSISVWVISVRHSRVRTSLRSVLFREIAPRCLSERSFRVGWVGTPPTHGLCPSADPCLCCSFFPILFSTSFHNCPSSSADGLSAVLSPNVDFDLSQGKKKKKGQPRERRLVVNSTFMVSEQKLYLHEKSNREGNKTWWFWDQTFSDSLRSPEVRKSLSAACFCVSALFSAQVRIFLPPLLALIRLSWRGKHMGMLDRA